MTELTCNPAGLGLSLNELLNGIFTWVFQFSDSINFWKQKERQFDHAFRNTSLLVECLRRGVSHGQRGQWQLQYAELQRGRPSAGHLQRAVRPPTFHRTH